MLSPDKPSRMAYYHARQDLHALPARRTAALLVGSIFTLMLCMEYVQNQAHWQSILLPRVAGICWAFGALMLMHGRNARRWGNVFHVGGGLLYPATVVWFGYELDRIGIGIGYLSMTQGFAIVDLMLVATTSRFSLLCVASLCNWLIAIASLQLFNLPTFAVATVAENATISLLLCLAIGRIMCKQARRHDNNLHLLKKSRQRTEQAMRQLASSHREMQHMADRDLLTGLYNRRAGIRHISQMLEQAAGPGDKALLEIDLDRFKPINDQHGHKAGDMVLQITAERLLTTLQVQDVCCRFGGDEFIVALCRDSSQAIRRTIDELDYALSRPIALPSGAIVSVSASIGYCPVTAHSQLEALIEQADNAMYLKKRERSCDGQRPFAERRQQRT
ncbi:GGDEF domain-containing protein [Vogesella sp. DC21W]|uniref:GGDEF domain-containing protein n=1 Tax=Vogesella aquatica TaxID=2984206 RepID=A0ABT5IV92_9NEIS|nr:GGDEF domain-containing protein [Vogesella aquatica]MDC7716121.1 GGDEF domain-containing protein [Vogesella aquatica]